MTDRSRRALETALERIRADESLNAWSYLAIDEALAAATESDMRLAAGSARSPLEGRLVAIKGNIAVRGWPFEGGLPHRRGLTAPADAALVTRLRQAGAVLLGLTRMDAGALGAEGRSMDGPIRNPHRPSHSVGGSSGGCAAAIAAGHVELAVGTDTIGSVRIPASLCGISSLKPSPARIDLTGVLPVHPDFDHAGPMTARADLLLPMLATLAGRPNAALSSAGVKDNRTARDRRSLPRELDSMPIGYVADAEAFGVTPTVLAHYQRALDVCRSLGATLVPFELAPLDPVRTRRAVFALAEHTMWQQHRRGLEETPEAFSPELRAMLEYGGSLTPPKLEALRERVGRFAEGCRAQLRSLGALLLPTTPGQAFAFDTPSPTDIADLTVLATAAGLPAVSVPIPVGDDLPVGLQIVAPAGEDKRACEFASAFERAR